MPANTATAISTSIVDAGPAPTGTGGTIVSGTYFLTQEQFYSGAPDATQMPATDKQTVVIDATAGTLAIVDTPLQG